MKLMSLFDGSGSFPLSAKLCGIKPVYASEVEPFPIAVTRARFPNMIHLGDVSKINGAELEPVDIVTFGSPCQDLSVAGKRAGLQDGARSSLFFQAIRIIKEMRESTNGRHPRFAVWENVHGAFSSNKGEDFKAVLEQFCMLGAGCDVSIPRPAKWGGGGCIMGDTYSVAWRTVDAQYWGVPQRRKRIYLVADLDAQRAGEILFKSESLSGYSPQGFKSWQGAARSAESSTGETGGFVLNNQGGQFMEVSENVTGTLRAQANGHAPITLEKSGVQLMFENHPTDSRIKQLDKVSETVCSRYGTGGGDTPIVLEDAPVVGEIQAFGVCSKDSNAMKSDNPNSGFYEADTSRTLDANGGNPNCNQGGIAVVSIQGSMIGREDKNGPAGSGVGEDVSFTLNTVDRHGVAYGIDRAAFNQGKNAKYDISIEEELNSSLVAKGPSAVAYGIGNGQADQTDIHDKIGALNCMHDQQAVLYDYIVRRLTPTECARLQGFPDWWCDDIAVPEPTEDDMRFWRGVFDTYCDINRQKHKTDNQIRKWLADPHTDSAEYKMWGNGCALPNAYYVIFGIAEVLREDDVDE